MGLVAGAVPAAAADKQLPAPPAGSAAVTSASACDAVAGNLVTNCGFEAGNFTGWTQGGNTAGIGVSPYVPHTGGFAAWLGPVGSDGTLAQQLTGATAGRTYTLDFYLRDPPGSDAGSRDFSVTVDPVVLPGGGVGSQKLLDISGQGPSTYQQYSYTVTTPSSSFVAPTLTFTARHDPSSWLLDDISVVGQGSADTTPPTLTLPADITTTATRNSQATVSYTATATDLVDGAVPMSCTPASGSTFPVGTTMVTCSATDKAGNTARGSFTVTVTYAWAGFFQPVDNPPTVNTVKAGSAIPVKFSLGGDQGLNIFPSGSPSSAPYQCDQAAPTDAIEQTVAAGTSGLAYDAATGQYTYVWKTDKGWTGCRTLVVKLADGSTHQANFQFTK